MILLLLVFVILCLILNRKYLEGKSDEFIFIGLSLLFPVSIFLKDLISFPNFLTTRDLDLYFIVGILISNALYKLFVLTSSRKSSVDILDFAFLIILAVPEIPIKVLAIVFLMLKNAFIKSNNICEVEKKFIIAVPTVFLLTQNVIPINEPGIQFLALMTIGSFFLLNKRKSDYWSLVIFVSIFHGKFGLELWVYILAHTIFFLSYIKYLLNEDDRIKLSKKIQSIGFFQNALEWSEIRLMKPIKVKIKKENFDHVDFKFNLTIPNIKSDIFINEISLLAMCILGLLWGVLS